MFGQSFLAEGINTTCALIGLFSMSQVFILMEAKIKERAKATKFSDKIRLTREEKKRLAPTVIRSWLIGNIIGILPGAGASIACFMAITTPSSSPSTRRNSATAALRACAAPRPPTTPLPAAPSFLP